MKYNVTVTCITDNPSVNSKVEVIEAESLEVARKSAEYQYGPARIISIELASGLVRNRFVRATPTQAEEYMEKQSSLCLDQVAAVNEWPWLCTNAGALAEAAAHWCFIAHPELRVHDNFWEGCDYCASIESMTGTRNCPIHSASN